MQFSRFQTFCWVCGDRTLKCSYKLNWGFVALKWKWISFIKKKKREREPELAPGKAELQSVY